MAEVDMGVDVVDVGGCSRGVMACVVGVDVSRKRDMDRIVSMMVDGESGFFMWR